MAFFLQYWRFFLNILFHKREIFFFLYNSRTKSYLWRRKNTFVLSLWLKKKKSRLSSGKTGSRFPWTATAHSPQVNFPPNKWSRRRSSPRTSTSVAANFSGHSSNSLESEITGGSQKTEALLLYTGDGEPPDWGLQQRATLSCQRTRSG